MPSQWVWCAVMVIINPFYCWGYWGPERFSCLLKAIVLKSGRTEFWTLISLIPKPTACTQGQRTIVTPKWVYLANIDLNTSESSWHQVEITWNLYPEQVENLLCGPYSRKNSKRVTLGECWLSYWSFLEAQSVQWERRFRGIWPESSNFNQTYKLYSPRALTLLI